MTFKKENYITTLEKAKILVPGFREAFSRFEERLVLDQCSKSMFTNYGRNLAHLALHFGRVPHQVSVDEINAYLYRLTVHDNLSISFFKQSVFGLRYWFRLFEMESVALQMPVIKKDKTLPTVLSKEECKLLFKASRSFKHRFLLAFAYAGGLRMNELRHVKISDLDLGRKQVKIRQGKGKKDRYVILSEFIVQKLPAYLKEVKPQAYLFEGQVPGEVMGERSIQYVINEALKKTEIKKAVSMHTLRHSFATHLLEDGVDIYSIQRLLGHSDIRTTIIYLHVAQVIPKVAHSPLDTLCGFKKSMRPQFEMAKIIRDYGDSFVQKNEVLKHHKRVLNALKICRTAELGGHVDRCDSCSHERISYNSCRNRHCPKCQNTNRERWILARKTDLLDCSYFHVVFTIPQELNAFCLKYPKSMYNILFQSSKETLFAFGNDKKHLGAQMGAISVLHTWGQNLSLHPHVHMIVPGGGFTKKNQWKNCKSNGDFLFPIRAMATVYRGKFMEKLMRFLEENKTPIEISLRRKLYDKQWVIYAKQPFKGPEAVVEYLGRYSHKIAISNHRLKAISEGKISFYYKDYAHGSVTKSMVLESDEFLRRFCMHILPPKFVKMRHYGFLSNRGKEKLKMEQMKSGKIRTEKTNIDYKEITKTKLGFDIDACPCCKTGRMIRILQFSANAPPIKINDLRKQLKNKK